MPLSPETQRTVPYDPQNGRNIPLAKVISWIVSKVLLAVLQNSAAIVVEEQKKIRVE